MRKLINSKECSTQNIALILAIFCVFFSLSLGAHLGRTLHKGQNYELAEYQDGIYYFAMARDLFDKPVSVQQELVKFPELKMTAEATLNHFLQNPKQWHLENGISHSPPYVYRILQPVIVAILGQIGIGTKLGFLLVSSFGLSLLGVVLTLLLINSRVSSKIAIFFSTCICISALNLIQNPMYTDYLFLGLLVTCIYLQKKGHLRSALLIAAIAVLNRETSLVIWGYLIAVLLANLKGNFKAYIRYLAFIPLAPVAFALPRFFIPVPNRDYPITNLIIDFFRSTNLFAFLVLVLFTLACSIFPYLSFKKKLAIIGRDDLMLFMLGFFGFVASCLLGGNWERFLLTFWPTFLLFDTLKRIDFRSSLIVLNGIGLLFLALNDFLAFNSNLSMRKIQIVEFIFLFGANWLIINRPWSKGNFQTF